MKENELRKALDEAISGCQFPEYRKRQILAQMKGEDEPVKKKLSVSLAVVIAVMILTLGAAVALIRSNIADHLYRHGGEAPEALLEQIQTPQETASAELGTITLDEWLYDGRALHTSVTIHNPTEETLLYTVDGLTLDGLPLDRTGGDLLMEGAGSAGVLLGGTLDETALPVRRALYHEAGAGCRFDENGRFVEYCPVPEGEQTLRMEVAVWRPVNPPELMDYGPYEGDDVSEIKDHLVSDESGYSHLWLFRPEDAYRPYHMGQSGAEAYAEVFRELGWAELVDTITLETIVTLSGDTVQQVKPVETVYQLDGCTLTLTAFQLSHAGGRLEADLSGDEQMIRQLLRDGLILVDRQGRRLLSDGSWWNDPAEGMPVHLTLVLAPVSGELPGEVWLAPVLEENSLWDPLFAGPAYDPEAPVPEDAVSIYRPDYARGVRMLME